MILSAPPKEGPLCEGMRSHDKKSTVRLLSNRFGPRSIDRALEYVPRVEYARPVEPSTHVIRKPSPLQRARWATRPTLLTPVAYPSGSQHYKSRARKNEDACFRSKILRVCVWRRAAKCERAVRHDQIDSTARSRLPFDQFWTTGRGIVAAWRLLSNVCIQKTVFFDIPLWEVLLVYRWAVFLKFALGILRAYEVCLVYEKETRP
jgi:hypothetical protein